MGGENLDEYKSTREIAEMFSVSIVAVGNWIKQGLPHEVERLHGRKVRRIMKVKDVEEFLNLGIRKKPKG
jgi:transposase